MVEKDQEPGGRHFDGVTTLELLDCKIYRLQIEVELIKVQEKIHTLVDELLILHQWWGELLRG